MILIAIGSNLSSEKFGKPINNCLEIIKIISKVFIVKNKSFFYKSEPIPKSDQPWYVNGVIEIVANIGPQEILKKLLSIENSFGRKREKKNESRVIDLDLLSFNNQVINTDLLILPHPRMHLRNFVLKPILDINPNWVHPSMKKTARELINEINDFQEIEKIPLVNS